MLLSENAKRLMLGYLLGAYTASIGLGLVIVFALPGSSATTTTRDTLSPAMSVVLGLISLSIAFALYRGPSERLRERREKRKQAQAQKGPPRWQRALDKGSARQAYLVGVALTLPGASYLVALAILHRQDLSDALTVLAVVAFCVLMLLLIEVPVLAFAFAPDGRCGPSTDSRPGSDVTLTGSDSGWRSCSGCC